MERKNKDGLQVDLKRLLLAVVRRWWAVVLAAVLCGTAAFGYAWLGMTPTYAASVQLYVNNNYVDSPGFSSAQLTAAKDLADTYMVILESRSVLEVVSKKTDGKYSYGQLKGMVSAEAINETEVFQVTVTSTNSKDAMEIANIVADVLPEKITAIVEGSSVRVVDYAIENPNPVGPSYDRYLTLGMLAGAIISIAVIMVMDVLDTTIKSEDDLAQINGSLPLLAVVPCGEETRGGYGKSNRGYYQSDSARPGGKKTGGRA